MTKRNLRRLMHLVLTTSATACGGAVATELGSAPGNETAGTNSETEPRPESKPRRDAGPPDASQPDTSKPDVVVQLSCVTGNIDPSADLCCDTPNDPACQGMGGGDQCQLDCRKVCEKVAPGLGSDGMQGCHYSASATDPKIYYYCGTCGVGRIPDDVATIARGGSVAERLAMQAYYEAASVVAFARLAGVLAAESAPQTLVRRVTRAAEDERRHAELFTRLAEARGACVPPLDDAPASSSLFALALENAREGCVRETYGALVALHQSQHAADAELRAAFATVADDEIAHAALSWELARYFDSRLSTEERALVERERRAATQHFREIATREHDAIDAVLGAPAPAKGRVLYDELFARVA